jgi:hypothetical protein
VESVTEKKVIHKSLAAGRWFELSLVEQLGNVGSDLERVIQWKKKGNLEYSNQAFDRMLELLDLTIADPKNRRRLKEIVRARYLLVDYFMYDNEHQSTDECWQQYFFNFAMAAAIRKGK